MSNNIGLSSFTNLGVGFNGNAVQPPTQTPTFQQVTEQGASKDQDVLFEFQTSYLDRLNSNKKATLLAENLNSNNEVFKFSGEGGIISTRKYTDETSLINALIFG